MKKVNAVGCFIFIMFLISINSAWGYTIGGWGNDFTPGSGSFATGSSFSAARNALDSTYSGWDIDYVGLNTLEYSNLVSADVVFLNSAVGGSGWFPSTINRRLTAQEQNDLYQYVLDGGSLIINAYGAYMTGSPAVQEISTDLLSPFGLSVSGGGSVSPHNYSVTSPEVNEITSDPFTVNSFSLPWDGYLNSTGTATVVPVSGGWGSNVLAYFDEGDLGPGSGKVVFITSSLWAMDSYIDLLDNQELLLNVFDFVQTEAVPLPSSLLLLSSGLIFLIRKRV